MQSITDKLAIKDIVILTSLQTVLRSKVGTELLDPLTVEFSQNVFRFCLISLHKKVALSSKNFYDKFGQIRRKLRIWSHLLKKFLLENFIFCAML